MSQTNLWKGTLCISKSARNIISRSDSNITVKRAILASNIIDNDDNKVIGTTVIMNAADIKSDPNDEDNALENRPTHTFDLFSGNGSKLWNDFPFVFLIPNAMCIVAVDSFLKLLNYGNIFVCFDDLFKISLNHSNYGHSQIITEIWYVRNQFGSH